MLAERLISAGAAKHSTSPESRIDQEAQCAQCAYDDDASAQKEDCLSSGPSTPQKTKGSKDWENGRVEDNFGIAATYYTISMFFSASQSVFGKLQYQQVPSLTPYQLLAYRAIFSTALNALIVNIRAKEALWDSIPKGEGIKLFIRVAQQNASIFITFFSIRQFELTLVSMVNNCATFVILILGYVFLHESKSLFSFLTLATSFGGTLLLLLGHRQQPPPTATLGSSTLTDDSWNATVLGRVAGVVLLVSNPFIIAIGVISMRRMRRLHDAVITTYMNVMLLFLMLIIVYATGSDLTPWHQFTILNWLCLLGLAVSNVGSQTLRFKAVQRSAVSRLQPLTYTQSLFQFVCDLLLFDEAFSPMQCWGLAIVLVVSIIMVIQAALGGAPGEGQLSAEQEKRVSEVAPIQSFVAPISCDDSAYRKVENSQK